MFVSALAARTLAATRSAARSGSSCSHTRTTDQPWRWRTSFVRWSRARFASSLVFHQPALLAGMVEWSGHMCQKQPSTYTATRARGNTTSAAPRSSRIGRMPTRYLRPRRWRARRRAISGAVSLRAWRDIRRRTESSMGAGRSVGIANGDAHDRSFGRDYPAPGARGRWSQASGQSRTTARGIGRATRVKDGAM
jgi:hypothetical protein